MVGNDPVYHETTLVSFTSQPVFYELTEFYLVDSDLSFVDPYSLWKRKAISAFLLSNHLPDSSSF